MDSECRSVLVNNFEYFCMSNIWSFELNWTHPNESIGKFSTIEWFAITTTWFVVYRKCRTSFEQRNVNNEFLVRNRKFLVFCRWILSGKTDVDIIRICNKYTEEKDIVWSISRPHKNQFRLQINRLIVGNTLNLTCNDFTKGWTSTLNAIGDGCIFE